MNRILSSRSPSERPGATHAASLEEVLGTHGDNPSPELWADAGPQIVTAYNKAIEILGIRI